MSEPKCACDPNRELPQSPFPCCATYTNSALTAFILKGTCFKCGHEEACHPEYQDQPQTTEAPA